MQNTDAKQAVRQTAPTGGSSAARRGRRRKRPGQAVAPSRTSAAEGNEPMAQPQGRKRRRRPAARSTVPDEEEAEVAALTAMAQAAAHLSAERSGQRAVTSAAAAGPAAATTSTPPLPGGFASSSPAWDADAAAARGGGGPPATSQAHPAPKRDLLTVRDALGQASQDGGRHRRRRTRVRRLAGARLCCSRLHSTPRSHAHPLFTAAAAPRPHHARGDAVVPRPRNRVAARVRPGGGCVECGVCVCGVAGHAEGKCPNPYGASLQQATAPPRTRAPVRVRGRGR